MEKVTPQNVYTSAAMTGAGSTYVRQPGGEANLLVAVR